MRITKRHLLGFAAALPLAWLTACGGSGDDGNDAHVRLVNASPGYASLDMYVDDDKEASAVTFGAGSDYAAVANGEPERTLTAAGSTTELLSQTSALDSGKKYTILAYGWEGALKSYIMNDDEDEADTDKTKVSAFNLAADAGDIDVYLTGADDTLEASTPIASSIDAGAQSPFSSVTSGTYRLRVTAASSKTDVRLDVPAVVLGSKQVLTLVMTPGRSGTLVHAIGVVQDGSVTPYLNTMARVRLVAAVADSGLVTQSIGSTSLGANVRSSTRRDYVLVNSGAQTLHTSVNGTALADRAVTLTAGSDTTVLVTGTSTATAFVNVIADDNRLPTVSTEYKLRLIHASPTLAAENLSLTINAGSVVNDLPFGDASAFDTQTADTVSLEISTPLQGTITTLSDLDMDAKGVYTVFMFDYVDGPQAIRFKER
ncbi:MAG TPA: DUF4397 domain-containing protein [Ideonella sp.]|uniref:DUF4397 domain-containing protein n=1 Tax=Ideonella sp. TaxID=1929293 RepID=UPI002E2FC09C|nr:DUF4397 domain-containing protein [Ideonella sp.]HEX5686950.1 DUF4397 domain-containing protein [Ideonella sp.]